jgi:hypothetical protein
MLSIVYICFVLMLNGFSFLTSIFQKYAVSYARDRYYGTNIQLSIEETENLTIPQLRVHPCKKRTFSR